MQRLTVRRTPCGSGILILPLEGGREASMSGSAAKQKALEAIEKLPADATLEDAIERLVLLAEVERGREAVGARKGIDDNQAKRRPLPGPRASRRPPRARMLG